MKTIPRIFIFVLSYVFLVTTVYAHPGHNHTELTLGELFAHMFAWGGLLVTLIIGMWLFKRVRNQRGH